MLNDSIDNLRLDINKPKVKASLSIRKGDTKSRTVHISLTSNGAVYSLENVLMAELLITKPDGKVCDQDMVVKGNELQYTFRTQDTNVVGENIAQIRLTFKDGAYLISPQFSIYVYSMILDQNTSKSENEYSQTDALFAQANEYYENAAALAAKVEEARNDADESASEAQTYYLDAKKYAKDAEDAKTDAVAAKVAAEAAAAQATAVGQLGFATTSVAGLVKPDGTTITVDANGVISSVAETAAKTSFTPGTTGLTSTNVQGAIEELKNSLVTVNDATTTTSGKVKPDGTTITVSNGTISAVQPTNKATLDKFSQDSTGNLLYNNAPISGGTTPTVATNTKVGTVKPDTTTITVDSNGTISAVQPTNKSTLDKLSTDSNGNLLFNNSAISGTVSVATTSAAGKVIPDGTTITVDNTGKISAVAETAAKTSFTPGTTGLTSTNVQGALEEVASNFQVGVNKIITAVNTKNGATSGDANYLTGSNTPTQIANAITNINTNANAPSTATLSNAGALTVKDSGGATVYADTFTNSYDKGVSDTKVGDAVVANVLSGKKFTSASGVGLIGTMTNNGAVSASLDTTTTSYTVPAGYHDGSGTVSITTQTKTVTPSATVQTVSADAGKVLSSVTVNAAAGVETETKTATPTTADQTITPSSGKYLSSVTVKGVSVPSAGNILSGSSVSSNSTTLVSGSMVDKSGSTTTLTTLTAGATNDETYTSFKIPANAFYSTTSELKITNAALLALNSKLNKKEFYEEWLRKGGVTKTFIDLSSVLSDEETVRQLMTIHDSADYLVQTMTTDTTLRNNIIGNATAMKWIGLRDYVCDNLMKVADVKTAMLSSTNWEYILKDHVPVMTSNTAPYGTAIGDSAYSDAYAFWKSFDNSTSTWWNSKGSTAIGSCVGYTFTNPIQVKKVFIMPYSPSEGTDLKDFKIQASNDGFVSDIHDLFVGTYPNGVESKTYIIENDDYYKSYRVYATSTNHRTSGNVNNIAIHQLQFYGRSLNVSVPTMTSNTAPWGEVSRSSDHSNGLMSSWKAFNSSSSDYWVSGGSGEQWIQYKFTKPVYIKYINIGETISSSSLVLKGSNDGTTWSNALFSFTIPTYSSYTNINGKITSDKEYKYYRVIISNSSTGWSGVKYLNFYGVDYSEREFESGSTMKYIYDHGVELESVVSGNKVGTFTKNDDSIYISGDNGIGFATTNKIDFTNYNLIRATLGDKLLNYTGANGTCISYSTKNGTSMWDSGAQLAYKTYDTGTVQYLDISSASGEYYPCIAHYSSTTNEVTITEWWLE